MILRKLIIYIALVSLICSCSGNGSRTLVNTSDSVKLSNDVNVVIDSVATEIMAEVTDYVEVPQSLQDSVVALLYEYKEYVRRDSTFTPETELERTLYEMKDSITDEDYFYSQFCDIYDWDKKQIIILNNDSLPSCYYVPIFASFLYSRNEMFAEIFSSMIGNVLLLQPHRFLELMRITSTLRNQMKYCILTDAIAAYLFEYFYNLSCRNDRNWKNEVSATKIPLYKYIKDDAMLNAYFIYMMNDSARSF